MILTTISKDGRLYIGCGDQQGELPKMLGDVNQYTGHLSKLITKFLSLSADIYIANEKFCLNKKSFKKHLNCLGIKPKDIKTFNYDAHMHAPGENFRNQYLSSAKLLSSILSLQERVKLTEEMIRSIAADKLDDVKSFVLKGAFEDKGFFYHKASHRFEVEGDVNHIASLVHPYFPHNQTPDVYNYYSTCFAYAADNNRQDLARFFYSIFNKDLLKGQMCYYGYQESDVYENYKNEKMLSKWQIYSKRTFIKDNTPGKEIFQTEFIS